MKKKDASDSPCLLALHSLLYLHLLSNCPLSLPSLSLSLSLSLVNYHPLAVCLGRKHNLLNQNDLT